MNRKPSCWTWVWTWTVGVCFTLSGCCTDLQRPYVDAMIRTERAIAADVKAGLYKPDRLGQKILIEAHKANVAADEALKRESK